MGIAVFPMDGKRCDPEKSMLPVPRLPDCLFRAILPLTVHNCILKAQSAITVFAFHIHNFFFFIVFITEKRLSAVCIYNKNPFVSFSCHLHKKLIVSLQFLCFFFQLCFPFLQLPDHRIKRIGKFSQI